MCYNKKNLQIVRTTLFIPNFSAYKCEKVLIYSFITTFRATLKIKDLSARLFSVNFFLHVLAVLINNKESIWYL